MRWYLVWLLFAQLPVEGKRFVMCETSQVLFQAKSGLEAYEKGVAWAKDYEKDNNFRFVGIEHLTSINDDEIADGTEISGKFIRLKDIWQRKDELIPDKFEIGTIKLEENSDTPVGELMTNEQKKKIRQVFEE